MIRHRKARVTKADYEALAAFRSALRRFLRFSSDAAREAGVTPQQHQLLLAIMGMPGRSWALVGELAESLQLSAHAAVGLVDRCAKAGLVRRQRNPEDRRQVRIQVTARGERILGVLSSRHRDELRGLEKLLRRPAKAARPRKTAARRRIRGVA